MSLSAHEQWRRMRETPALVRLQEAERQIQTLRARLEDLVSCDTTPDANCSCFLAPPCGDCVEYGFQRMAVADAKEALAATKEV